MKPNFSLFIAGLAAGCFLLPSARPALALTAAAPASTINGFNDPGGFVLNANSGGYLGQDATAHGVPTISGGTLHLTTTQGVSYTFINNGISYNGFVCNDLTSAYASQKHYIGQFYASFVYHYNGTNPLSYGPGDGFTFNLQNDPNGVHALGSDGFGNGRQNDGSVVIAPSVAAEFNIYSGFAPVGIRLAYNGDPGIYTAVQTTGAVDLLSGHPISVILSYDGATLSETLTDTVTHAGYNTSYAANLPAALGSSYAYVGFTGGSGAASADQTITNFLFRSTATPAIPPVNLGPRLTVAAVATPLDALGIRYVTVSVTNVGGIYADQVVIAGISVNGLTPILYPAGDIHNVLPTIPNLLSPGVTETDTVAYPLLAANPHSVVTVSGTYIDPVSGGLGHFSGSARIVLP